MSNATKIVVVAVLLLIAVASPAFVLSTYPEAFGSVTRTLVLGSAILGLITGIVGIWIWIKTSPSDGLRLLPESSDRRLVALCGLMIVGVGGYSGNVVMVAIGFALVALSVAYKRKQGA
jgi:hypothetical protein